MIEEGGVAVSLYKVEVRRIIKIIRKDKSLPEQNSISGSENIARKGTPQCLRLSAVFTLEAAVVMPVLACFFVSVLFFFRIMQIQLEVQKALDDTGRKLAVCAAAVSSDGAALPGIAEALLLREMADRTEAETYITGGKFGISLIGSDFSGEEITLRAAYHIRLPIRIFWLWDFAMEQRADCRKWTGWSAAEGSDEDQWVYVTQTGTVYHREYSCTHLELSIQSVAEAEIAALRNENGEAYRKCMQCRYAENAFGRLYITNQGDCYHKDLGCSGIKRTVRMIRLSEVGTRRPCSRCGQ